MQTDLTILAQENGNIKDELNYVLYLYYRDERGINRLIGDYRKLDTREIAIDIIGMMPEETNRITLPTKNTKGTPLQDPTLIKDLANKLIDRRKYLRINIS